MRPERYGDSGYTELERELEARPNSPLWMDPLECGERVLAGIRRDDLYIFTHREFREGADERFRAMLASFPDEPLNDARAEAIDFLLSNPDLPRRPRASVSLSRRRAGAGPGSFTILLTFPSRAGYARPIVRLSSERMDAATPRAAESCAAWTPAGRTGTSMGCRVQV